MTYLLLILLSIFPIFYKFSFWLYTIQLKEYRWDRFREYLTTPQGRSAIFNFWFNIEIPVFIATFLVYLDDIRFEGGVLHLVLYFLLFQNIFVFGKIFRKKLIVPKLTPRLVLIISFLIIGIVLDLYYIINYFPKFIYNYIIILFIFSPIIIFITNLILFPIINYQKYKLIKKAIIRTKDVKNPIKIAITGSYGKTSVKEFLYQILDLTGKTLRTPENINSELGVSNIILDKLNDSYKYFIAEIGAYRVGEIALLGDIVNHKYGFLTAIGNQHVGLFGDVENTKKAKSEIENSIIKNNGILYLNWDNQNIRETNFDKNLKIIKYGTERNDLDAKSTNINIVEGFNEFDFVYRGEEYKFQTNLIGKHNVVNLTGIIAFCIDLEVSLDLIKSTLLNLHVPKDTMELERFDCSNREFSIINDTHNLSEAGLLSGLEVLNAYSNNKSGEKIARVLVMDDILELGKEATKIHFELGKKIAMERLVDQVLFLGVNYDNEFKDGLLEGGLDKNNILENLDKLENNSIILFEGKKAGNYLSKLKDV